MKKLFWLLAATALLSACGQKNAEYIEQIQQDVETHYGGMHVKFKSIEFKWVDTIYYADKVRELQSMRDSLVGFITGVRATSIYDYNVANIYSLSYLTRDRLEGIRNWENQARKDPGYIMFACANKDKSKWLADLCEHTLVMDSLVNGYGNITEGDYVLVNTVAWYYARMEHFKLGNVVTKELQDAVVSAASMIMIVDHRIDELSSIRPDSIFRYVAYDKYSVTISGDKMENVLTTTISSLYYFSADKKIKHSKIIND